MRKIAKISAVISLVLLLFSLPVNAANNVSEIDISVTVRDDGSAYIVQNWKGTFDEGTENYIPINTEDIAITDFKVSDKDGAYTFVKDWYVNWAFFEKARKCGINETSDGIELCFGISEYGENRYAIEYVVEDFIKGYTDYDGCNFMFINPGMSTFPTSGHINITLQNGTRLDENNAGIWAFGYDGYIEFENGKVNAYTTTKLTGENSMIVMLCLNKGIITPRTNLNESFDTVKNKAFDGSDYETGLFEQIFGFIVFLIVFGVILAIIIFIIKRKKAIKKFYKEADYFREAPNSGKIEISHYLAGNFDVTGDKSLVIGAMMLSMINKGCIEPQIDENVGFFGKVKESVNLKLIKAPEVPCELKLYELLVASAGDDGILQEKELEKYSFKNPEKIIDVVDSTQKSGEAEFISLGGFSNGAGNCIKDLSDNGKDELAQVMGLKKYLEDFTLISERGINETAIWKEYMIYATLFGIADKVIKQFEKVYPESLPEIETYNKNVVVAHSYYHSMHRSAQRAIQAKRVSGGGGKASFGGGGGFSGGGHGGGSR